MNKKLFFLFFSALGLISTMQAQFHADDIRLWTGSGSDTAILVVDFRDGSPDSSYAWGFLFSAPATGADMLQAINAADPHFNADVSAGFLGDITYRNHQGISGSPDYWSTWSGTNPGNWQMNGGIGTALSNGSWFGCSYGFNPAPVAPGEPVAAPDPAAFTIDDLTYFTGSGQDTAMLVIDFLNGSDTTSFAWGYLFNDSTTGLDMIQDIAAGDPSLNVIISSGFLSDIYYRSFSGVGGSPHYWATWSATDLGNWQMNSGLSTVVRKGHLFGCTYTDFSPPLSPHQPVAASNTTGLNKHEATEAFRCYPVPANDFMTLEWNGAVPARAEIHDTRGALLHSEILNGPVHTIDISGLPPGPCFLKVNGNVRKLMIE